MTIFSSDFLIPFLSLKLNNDLNVREDQLGYFFLINAVAGILTATPGVFLLRKCFRLSSIIAFGAVLNLIASTLLSMSPRLGLPHSLSLVWIGFTLNGAAASLLYSPILPYLIDYYGRHQLDSTLPEKEYKPQLLSKTIAVFNITVGVA